MKRSLTPYIFLSLVLCTVIALCAFTTRGHFVEELPVKMVLPENMDGYQSFDVLHCQNENCLKSFSSEDLTNTLSCPECGGKLDLVSVAEYQLLPRDTKILHKSYKSASGQIFMVSVVIGGYERRSIHKPQVCIVGQGNTINGQRLMKVPLAQDKYLDTMLIDINRSKLYFAYWFTNGERETALHLTRLLRTAWDGIIHNERRRWAYISVAVANNNSSEILPELKIFISRIHFIISNKDQLLPLLPVRNTNKAPVKEASPENH